MSVEKNPTQPTLIQVTARGGRGGSYVDTRPFVPHEEIAETQLTIISNELIIWASKPPMSLAHWERVFDEQIKQRKLDTETARKLYADPHRAYVYGEVTNSDTPSDSPEVLRQKLMDKNLGAMQAYRLGVLAIRKPQERGEKESINLGKKLIERAIREDPTNPRYPRAFIEEALEIRRQKYEKKKKEKREPNKTYSGEYSVVYYAEKIQYWTDVFEKHARERRIEWNETFKKRHKEILIAASKVRKKGDREKAKNQRLEIIDYEKALHDEDLNIHGAYFWGLVALTTPTKLKARGIEPLAFMFLNKMYDLADKEYNNELQREYWKAFAAWVNKEELFKKKCQVEPKRHAKAKAWHNEIGISQVI